MFFSSMAHVSVRFKTLGSIVPGLEFKPFTWALEPPIQGGGQMSIDCQRGGQKGELQESQTSHPPLMKFLWFLRDIFINVIMSFDCNYTQFFLYTLIRKFIRYGIIAFKVVEVDNLKI